MRKESFDPFHVGIQDAAEFLGVHPRTIKNREGKLFPEAKRDVNGYRYWRLDDLYVMYLKFREHNPDTDFLVSFLRDRGFDDDRIRTWTKMMVIAREKEGL